ncbi:MAG TPA: transcriptional regulator [Candidatus Ornithospirochaeta stercorigallinarum]|nr:transcriptional regulator [Candidatus Ornithospirochaeta stercorigallinarum]
MIDAMSTREDFSRAKTRARFQSLLNTLTWKNTDLLSFYEVTSIIKPKSETYRGMQTIPVSRIIGSEGRYHDFSSAFFPKREMLRNRWESVDRAVLSDIVLPPISVFSLGGYYFVRDGNHRVSVAKAQGVEFIDAEVVELDSQIPLEEGMTMKTLRRRVVTYERNAFIQQYKPSYLPMGEIVFTSPGAYPEMVNHILVHKYFINQNQKEEIPFEQAAVSWYKNVYAPIVKVIREEHLLFQFPGSTEGDMYLWIVRTWDDMKRQKKNQNIPIEEAAEEIKKRNKALPLFRYIKYFLSKLRKD